MGREKGQRARRQLIRCKVAVDRQGRNVVVGGLSKASVRFKRRAQHSGVVVTGEESGRGRMEQMSKELKAGSGATTLHHAHEFWASTTRGGEKTT